VDIKEYIESGILEAYALGALTEDERTGVEADIAMYPELAEELAAIEATMHRLADEHAVTPPAFMQEQIWNSIKPEAETQAAPASPAPPKSVPLMPEDNRQRQPSWLRAAIWAAVAVSVLTNFMLLSQRNASREEQKILAAKVDSMAAEQQQLATVIGAYKKEMDMQADPAMQTIVMRKEGDNKMAGMVYWSKDKGEAYLALHNIPMPPQGKQYQLWVIQDGKPVDMGVISNDMVTKDGMVQKIPMTVASGQAFAISIENEGGNPTPTQVFMVGAV
jgi:anti-sigma-K factor RskA